MDADDTNEDNVAEVVGDFDFMDDGDDGMDTSLRTLGFDSQDIAAMTTTDPKESTVDSDIISALCVLGATEEVARSHLSAMRSSRPAATFSEVYGGGAIVDCANHACRDLNVNGLRAFDIRTTKPNGTPWDFTVRADRKLARETIDRDDPDWLIGSPPCTAFAIWNYAMNYPKRDKGKVRQAIAEGRTHLNFVVSLYRKQMMRGK